MTRSIARLLPAATVFLVIVADGHSQGDKKNGKGPSLEQTLAWLKSVDVSKGSSEKFASMTVEDLKTLKDIRLGGHRKSDDKHVNFPAAEFRYVAALPALEKLDLAEHEGVTDEALVHIGKIATLKELNFADGKATGAGLRHLVNLKELTYLHAGWSQVDDAGMPFVAKLAKLEFLALSATKVTDAGLAQVARLPGLKELRIPDAVTDTGLQALAGLKSLTTIKYEKSKCKVTQQGMDRLQKALPNLKFVALVNGD